MASEGEMTKIKVIDPKNIKSIIVDKFFTKIICGAKINIYIQKF
jgi:hypothetical protein